MLTVSVVISAYNEEKYIGRLLASIQKLPQENLLEVLVIDNGSTDKTKEVVRIASLDVDSFGSKIRIIDESRKGVAWARARGAQEARGEIIAFFDADTEVPSVWMSRLLTFMAKEKVVCVSGPSYYYEMSKFWNVFVHIYWGIAVIISKLTGFMGNFANMAVRREAFQKIGGIDTSIVFYGDDTNITRRLSKIGKVVFSQRFFIYASARRFSGEGIVATSWRYMISYLSQILPKMPSIKKGYTEIR